MAFWETPLIVTKGIFLLCYPTSPLVNGEIKTEKVRKMRKVDGCRQAHRPWQACWYMLLVTGMLDMPKTQSWFQVGVWGLGFRF